MALTSRIEIRADEDFIKALEDLSNLTSKNRADVIRDALSLYSIAIKERILNHKGIVFQDLTTEPSTERLEFRTDPGFISLIQELADKDGVTRAEIVRRAIGLYAWAADEADKGHVLTPTPSTSNPTKTHKTEETYLAVAVAERVEQGKERVFTLEESLADLGL
jgi:predicted DNA-binding protein